MSATAPPEVTAPRRADLRLFDQVVDLRGTPSATDAVDPRRDDDVADLGSSPLDNVAESALRAAARLSAVARWTTARISRTNCSTRC
jgi:hypothetical protein